jgi:hypothetical protein
MIFVGKQEEKRAPGRPKHGWENNITIHVLEMRCGDGWYGLN